MKNYTAPRVRREGLVIEELGAEVLIYDTMNDQAHTLNRTAALVWKLCDGKRTVGEIAIAASKGLQHPFSEQVVWFTLAKLDEFQLLDISLPIPKVMSGMSRREFITKFAVAAAVVPVVKTLKIPVAGNGISCGGSGAPCISPTFPTNINGPTLPPCCVPFQCCAGFCGECG